MQDATEPTLTPPITARSRRLKPLVPAILVLALPLCVAAVYLVNRRDGEQTLGHDVRTTEPGPAPSPPNAALAPGAGGSGSTTPLSLPRNRPGLLPDPQTWFQQGAGPTANGVPSRLQTQSSPDIDRLKERLKAKPDDVMARIALLTQLDLAGRPSEAEDVIREALQRGQRHHKLYHALGTLYMQHKQYDAAAEAFRCEVEVAPRDVDANLRLAQCYSLVGQRELAQKYFDKVLKLKPSEPDTYIGIAFLNSSSQRSPLAIKYLKKYIQLAKDPGQGYLLLSRILVNQNRNAEAIDAGLKGVAAMPDNAEMWYNLGQAYAYTPGDKYIDQAQEALERVILLAPNNGHGRFELARLYQKRGRYDEAAAQYGEAVRCEPLNGRYHYQYGRALTQAKRPDEAARELARAKELIPLNQREDHLRDRLSVVPKDIAAWCDLARIYEKYGDIGMAKACLERALRVNPDHPTARQDMQRLATGAAPGAVAP